MEFRYLPVDRRFLQIERSGTGGAWFYPDPDRADDTRKLIVINAFPINEEVLGFSSGEANQGFRLTQRPVLLPRDPESQDYLQVEVDTGGGYQRWERVGTLLYSLSFHRHYIVCIHENDEAEIVFGDGQYGQIPPLNSTIRSNYLIGGGTQGNVGPGTIRVVKSGVNTNIKIENPKAASGGAERESIDHARRQAPGVFRSLKRAITTADYVALAENFPGVVKATAVAPSWNYVDIYVVAAGNQEPSPDLKARLIQYFETKRMVTSLVNVRNPVFIKINIAIPELGVEPSFYQDDVEQRVRESLADLFRIDRLNFGQSFYLSKIYEAIESVAGVAYVRDVRFRGVHPAGSILNPSLAETGLIQLNPREFPRQGSLNIGITTGELGNMLS